MNAADPVGPAGIANRALRLADAAQYRAKRTGCLVPVIAGREVPLGALTPSAVEGRREGERRAARGQQGQGTSLIEAALHALDTMRDQPVPSRLGLVSDMVTQHVDGVGWWLSVARPDAEAVTTVDIAVYRSLPGLAPEEVADEIGASFPFADFPISRKAVSGYGFLVSADDPGIDPSERAVIDELKATAALVAGGTDAAGDRWLVEIYADELSQPVAALLPVLRALVAVALQPPGE
jgi:hypothetical protein